MNESQPQASDFASPALVEALFYEAFAQIDMALMTRVWLDSERAYCVHPGGQPLLGSRAVLESWHSMFQGAQSLVLFYKVLNREEWGDLAIHLVEERLSSRDGSQHGLVMATNCYVKTGDGWRLFSHHGSSLSLPRPKQPEASPQIH
ncbi:MAG: nuclear transport factor 2 family protein [Candidatus Thiodiazotropha sp.]